MAYDEEDYDPETKQGINQGARDDKKYPPVSIISIIRECKLTHSLLNIGSSVIVAQNEEGRQLFVPCLAALWRDNSSPSALRVHSKLQKLLSVEDSASLAHWQLHHQTGRGS